MKNNLKNVIQNLKPIEKIKLIISNEVPRNCDLIKSTIDFKLDPIHLSSKTQLDINHEYEKEINKVINKKSNCAKINLINSPQEIDSSYTEFITEIILYTIIRTTLSNKNKYLNVFYLPKEYEQAITNSKPVRALISLMKSKGQEVINNEYIYLRKDRDWYWNGRNFGFYDYNFN